MMMNKTLAQLQREDDAILRRKQSSDCQCGCKERYAARAEMFAEAIADAKAVRATALKNAKEALDAAFYGRTT